MANYLHGGFMGTATIGDESVRFNSCSILAKQEVITKDLVQGNWQKMAFVYGPVTVGGSLGGPLTASFTSDLVTWATHRTDCGVLDTVKDIDVRYYCGSNDADANAKAGRKYKNCYINSLQLDCTAGDMANFTIDVMGKEKPDNWGGGSTKDSKIDKFLTFDMVTVTLGSNSGPTTTLPFQSLNFTWNNNLSPQYRLGQNSAQGTMPGVGLYPFDILSGIANVEATITTFDIATTFDGYESWDSYAAQYYNTLTINLGGLITISAQGNFNRVETTLAPDLITSSIKFTGIGDQTVA